MIKFAENWSFISLQHSESEMFFPGDQSRRLLHTPLNSSVLWAAVLAVFSLLGSSCVHEWPDPGCGEPYRLRLEFDTSWETMSYDYTRAQATETQMVYTIRAFALTDGGDIDRDNYREVTFSRDISGGYDCDTSIDLGAGRYRVMAWAGFTTDGRQYYDTADFAGITVDTDPYSGDTDLRDAFRGWTDIEIPAMARGTEDAGAVIEMARPLARYEFISTGLGEFLEEEGELVGKTVTLDDYYVVVSYPQFMPNSYNMFTSRPNDSLTGISFEGALSPYGDDEALLGFDYVFVNGSDASVEVRVSVYRKADGQLVSRTPMVRVPLKRSFNTVVKGSFLLRKSSGGVGINPDYDGDINISAPLVPA